MTLYVSGSIPAEPEPLDEDGHHDSPPWWTTRYGRWRLAAEEEAMRRHFPSFVPFEEHPEDARGWLGWLQSALPGGARYCVRVIYPQHFPEESPVVLIEYPRVSEASPPHMLGGRQPCLYLPSGGPRNGYDPQTTTAATFIAWTALWIHAYETWRATGKWPGKAD